MRHAWLLARPDVLEDGTRTHSRNSLRAVAPAVAAVSVEPSGVKPVRRHYVPSRVRVRRGRSLGPVAAGFSLVQP